MCARYQCFVVIKTLSVSWKYSTLPSNSFLTFYVINYTSLMVSQIVLFLWFSPGRPERTAQDFFVTNFFLVGCVSVVGGLVDFSQVAVRPLSRIQHGWAKGQAGLVLFSHVPSLVPSVHKRPSVFQPRPRSPGSGPVTQACAHESETERIRDPAFRSWEIGKAHGMRTDESSVDCCPGFLNRLLVLLEFQVLKRCMWNIVLKSMTGVFQMFLRLKQHPRSP